LENLKKGTLTLISVALIGLISLCLALSPFTSIPIRSSGRIIVCVPFDKCNQIGDWKIYSSRDSQAPGYNTLEVDTADKVEGSGSFKGTFAANAPNYGGQFYKSNGSFWNLENTPLLRMWMKINQTMYPAFRLEIICSFSWDTFGYEILDQLAVGEWKEVVVDLRLPDYKPNGKLPRLNEVHRLCISYWYGYSINNPQVVWWDNITLWTGSYIPPQAEITPISKTVMVNETVSFSARILGGEAPYSYSWWVNGTQQQGQTSNTFNLARSTAGKYNVTVVVSDNRGNTGSTTAWVTVLTPPPGQSPIPSSLDVFKSEVRGIFVWNPWDRNPDWTLIAQTCFDYGINTAVIEVPKEMVWDYSNNRLKDFPQLRTAISAFHAKGMNVHVLLVIGLTAPSNMQALSSSGEKDWLDFTKNASRQMLREICESLAKDYDIDGFVFDYIRWPGTDMPLGEEARQKFIADTGLNDVNWYSDVLYGGRYYWQFIEWRMKVIDETVRDMVGWMKAIKPNLLFSATVFTAFQDCGNYWAMQIGQHTAEWVDKGYLDFVCPMLYGRDYIDIGLCLEDSLDFYTGGREGKVPMIPYISMNPGASGDVDVSTFVEIVRTIKEKGADGWVIWGYGGPGINLGTSLIDIRPYFSALFDAGLMEPVWAIQNLNVQINGNEATISWTTTTLTKGKIEYSTNNIFNATIRFGDFDRPFHYKDIEYVGGEIEENATFSTTHLFTIQISDSLQIRIQSIDENGVIVTSKPLSILP